MPNPTAALRALLDDHEQRYGRGDLWRAASEEMDQLEGVNDLLADALEALHKEPRMKNETKTRTEMYQVVRDALAWRIHGHVDCDCPECKGIVALAALEAQEREAPPSLGEEYEAFAAILQERATPPAPPAAECACKVAMATAGVPLEVLCICIESGLRYREISDALQQALIDGRNIIRAALASPCCEGLREELADVRRQLDAATRGRFELGVNSILKVNDQLSAELAAANSEIARLTAERETSIASRCAEIADECTSGCWKDGAENVAAMIRREFGLTRPTPRDAKHGEKA